METIIWSIKPFKTLTKATEAIATVQRIDGQIAREENRITILEERIASLQSGEGFDFRS